ncbi:MAG TPA: hypothetical protein VKH41_13515 [Myxococcota bacterium]|nr:hypothetical protein [Myxococcota bacterium]
MKMRRRGAIAAGLCAIAGLACWRAPLRGIDFGPERDPFRNAGHIEPEEIASRPVYRLLLIGDAGSPTSDDPTLALVGEWGNADPAHTAAIYLGDNVYPNGLQGGRARAHGEAVLLQQIDATSARKLFVPGNHDWGATPFQRLARGVLRNEQDFIEARASAGVRFDPHDGCPGPVAVQLLRPTPALSGGLTVILLDLDWWLLPERARPVCEGIRSTDDFIARLRAELGQRRSENVVVVAHHPIRSGGEHGGYTRGFWTDLGVSIYYRFYTAQDLVEPTITRW